MASSKSDFAHIIIASFFYQPAVFMKKTETGQTVKTKGWRAE